MSSPEDAIELEIERILEVFERNCKRFRTLELKKSSKKNKTMTEKGEANGEIRKPA